jgi:predicted enzyme related to lactoylglutathione lyase
MGIYFKKDSFMPRPVHFEIPADDPEKAIGFYSTVFGWKFSKWDGPMEYWTISTGQAPEPGIDGGLMRRRDPNQPCVNTTGVENIDHTIEVVQSAGGLLVVPKMPIPGIGWLAYCKDPEGYIFGVMQNDPSAG